MSRRYCKIFFLFFMMLVSGHAFAQPDTVEGGHDTVKLSADTLDDAAYSLTLPKNTKTIYNIHFSGVLFTLLLIGMIYISYRYWADNWRKPKADDTPDNGNG